MKAWTPSTNSVADPQDAAELNDFLLEEDQVNYSHLMAGAEGAGATAGTASGGIGAMPTGVR